MKPELNLFRVVIVTLLIGTAGCKKGNNGVPISTSTISILAVQNDSIFTWKNGVVNNIYSQNNVVLSFGPTAMAPKNNDLYIAGWQPSAASQANPFSPAYWLNGSVAPLQDSTGSVGLGWANAVAVSGNDVYFAGTRFYDPSDSKVPYTNDSAVYPIDGNVATVWKNGTPTTLPSYSFLGLVNQGQDGSRSRNDYVSAMCVSGDNVYVAGGSFYTPEHAAYWTNGARTDLDGNLVYQNSNGGYSTPQTTGIAVSGSDVYVSGYEMTSTVKPLAIYWKNGTLTFLSTDSLNGSSASAIAVSGSDVYVAGFQTSNGYSRAMIWKNGVGTALTSGNTSSTAMAVCVHGSDVYVAGYTWVAGTTPYVACYWKNGVIVNITDGASPAIAYSISVE